MECEMRSTNARLPMKRPDECRIDIADPFLKSEGLAWLSRKCTRKCCLVPEIGSACLFLKCGWKFCLFRGNGAVSDEIPRVTLLVVFEVAVLVRMNALATSAHFRRLNFLSRW
jgi:hypothetical protein